MILHPDGVLSESWFLSSRCIQHEAGKTMSRGSLNLWGRDEEWN